MAGTHDRAAGQTGTHAGSRRDDDADGNDQTDPPDTRPGKNWIKHTARNRGGGEVFSLMLSARWQLTTANGIDSFAGEIRGERVLLRFDLGWYSYEPKPELKRRRDTRSPID